jgi:hypothetical protein
MNPEPVRTHTGRFPRCPPAAKNPVRFLPALRDIGQRDIGDLKADSVQLALDLLEPLVVTRDPNADLATGSDQIIGGFAGLTPPSHFLTVRVSLCLGLVRCGDHLPTVALQLLGAIE